MTDRERLCVILGGGGHARVLIEVLRASGAAEPAAILDADSDTWGRDIMGVRVRGGDELLPSLIVEGIGAFVIGVGAVGDNEPRQRLFDLALSAGLFPLTVRHPSTVCSPSSEIGAGSVVFPGAIVNTGAVIGRNVIINTGAIVEHDCVIGDHAHIATGARLASTVHVGVGAHIGAGATVRQGISIGDWAIVGAGAAVVSEVRPQVTVVGVPAR